VCRDQRLLNSRSMMAEVSTFWTLSSYYCRLVVVVVVAAVVVVVIVSEKK